MYLSSGIWYPIEERWIFVRSQDLAHFYSHYHLLLRNNYPAGQRALPNSPNQRRDNLKMEEESDVMWGYGLTEDQGPFPSQANQPYQAQTNDPYILPYSHSLPWPSEYPQPNGTLLFGAPIPGSSPGDIPAMDQGWQQEGQYFNDLPNTPWRAQFYESQASDPPNTLCPSDVEPPSPVFKPSSYAWTVSSQSSDGEADHSQAEEQPKEREISETRRSLPTQRPLQPAAPVLAGPQPRRKHRPRIAPITDDVRSYRDHCILEGRELGLTYGAIRHRYNLPEAESTLRGRCRTLMKSKEQRVRKPVWQENDVQLLLGTVRDGMDAGKRGKSDRFMAKKNGDVRWKDVAERLEERGASYPFSASACKKKWEERHES